jgi:hypothetical protein
MSEHSDQHSERDPAVAEQQSGEQAREQYVGATGGGAYAAAGKEVERGESRRQRVDVKDESETEGEGVEPHAGSASSSAAQAKQREREMEESGEESPG